MQIFKRYILSLLTVNSEELLKKETCICILNMYNISVKGKQISSLFFKFLQKFNGSTSQLAFFKLTRHDGAAKSNKSIF